MGMLLGTKRALLGVGDSFRAVLFNGTTTTVNGGSEAGLDDLHDAAMTAELWMRDDASFTGRFLMKQAAVSTGWMLLFGGAGLIARVYCAVATGQTNYNMTKGDGILKHVAFTWDDATYTSPQLWLNGLAVGAEVSARNGAILSDAAGNFVISQGGTGMNGPIAWVRLSNTVRYTATFTPPSILNPPAVDGNTVLQYNFDEGSGVTLDNAEGTAARDGTIANGVWITVKI